jgi:putative transposase
MLLSLVCFVLRRLLQALASSGRSDVEREVELLVLRHQVKVLSRGARRPLFRRRDRMLLAAASWILPKERWRAFLVTPRTVLRWHQHLVRRKWTYRRRRAGRPGLDQETVQLITRLAEENPRWGYLRIRGELLKLGIRVSATAIRVVLRRHGLGPAPRRSGPSWSEFVRAQAHVVLAFDFFTVETAWLRTWYVLFDRARVSSRARPRGHQEPGFGLGDPASQESRGGGAASRDPVRDPRQRLEVLRSVRRSGPDRRSPDHQDPGSGPESERLRGAMGEDRSSECLDHLLVLGRPDLERILREFVTHYNASRPHRALQLAVPEPSTCQAGGDGRVSRRDRLGGLIHEYYREAA